MCWILSVSLSVRSPFPQLLGTGCSWHSFVFAYYSLLTAGFSSNPTPHIRYMGSRKKIWELSNITIFKGQSLASFYFAASLLFFFSGIFNCQRGKTWKNGAAPSWLALEIISVLRVFFLTNLDEQKESMCLSVCMGY